MSSAGERNKAPIAAYSGSFGGRTVWALVLTTVMILALLQFPGRLFVSKASFETLRNEGDLWQRSEESNLHPGVAVTRYQPAPMKYQCSSFYAVFADGPVTCCPNGHVDVWTHFEAGASDDVRIESRTSHVHPVGTLKETDEFRGALFLKFPNCIICPQTDTGDGSPEVIPRRWHPAESRFRYNAILALWEHSSPDSPSARAAACGAGALPNSATSLRSGAEALLCGREPDVGTEAQEGRRGANTCAWRRPDFAVGHSFVV